MKRYVEITVYVRFVSFLDCYFATIKDLCCEMFVRDRQTDGLANWL